VNEASDTVESVSSELRPASQGPGVNVKKARRSWETQETRCIVENFKKWIMDESAGYPGMINNISTVAI